MNNKLKRALAISGLIFCHLLATAFLEFALFADTIARLYDKPQGSYSSAPIMKFLLAIFEFPLVHLAKLIAYSPGSPWSSVVALCYLLSYFANSILWGIVFYQLLSLVTRRRMRRD